jgi:hypothetical protein
MKNLTRLAIVLFAIWAQAQMQPSSAPAVPTPPRVVMPGNPAVSTGVTRTATPPGEGATLGLTASPTSPVGRLPGPTSLNNIGTTVNTVAGPCNPGVPRTPAPLGLGTTSPLGTTTGTGVPTTGITVVGGPGGAPTVIGNTNLNSPGPASGTSTVAQPCIVGPPANTFPAPLPSPTP